MPFGISNITTITMNNITSLGNISADPMEFFIKANHIIFGGILYFVIMWIVLIVIYLALQKFEDQPLINAMYASAVVSVLSILFRLISMSINGVNQGLLTDRQMWIFPIITAVLIFVNWATRER